MGDARRPQTNAPTESHNLCVSTDIYVCCKMKNKIDRRLTGMQQVVGIKAVIAQIVHQQFIRRKIRIRIGETRNTNGLPPAKQSRLAQLIAMILPMTD